MEFLILRTVARHPSERLSQSKILLALALLLESTLGIDFQLSKMITTLALELPGSRKQVCLFLSSLRFEPDGDVAFAL